MYRHLQPDEVKQLSLQACTATDWDSIRVHTNFSTDRVHRTHFVGENTLGDLSGEISNAWQTEACGIYDATLINSKVGSHVLIKQVRKHIANYTIGSHSILRDVFCIEADSHSLCGQMSLVPVLNETGGRDVPLHPKLNAQMAYMIAMYRHLSQSLDNWIELAKEDLPISKKGHIGQHVCIENTSRIKNVYIGDYTQIKDVQSLEEGWIDSNQNSPVLLRNQVIAHTFTLQAGAQVYNHVELDHVLAGQNAIISSGFSAENALFFSNSHLSRGEACATLGGPFTVSHHKSTLLIGGALSFSNAGSGTNQSNHMYKLGPIHQGMLERGVKTSSDSYLLWPAVVGAFSVVMGRHYHNTDSSIFPFSYLMEQQGRSYLIPAVNIRSIGTIRDAQKWPKRDQRTEPLIDLIHYEMLNPYTVGQSLKGMAVLQSLQNKGKDRARFTYNRINIESGALNRGIKLYTLIAKKYLGSLLAERLEPISNQPIETIRQSLVPSEPLGKGEWLDLFGLLAPKESILDFIEQLKGKQFNTFQQTIDALAKIHQTYPDYEWAWAYSHFPEVFGVDLTQCTKADLARIISQWQDHTIELNKMLLDDAKKEFNDRNLVSFGIDGDKEDARQDFHSVRGQYETNATVLGVHSHSGGKLELAQNILNQLG